MKRKTNEERAYHHMVAKLPCAACYGRPVQLHHPRGYEFGTGMGLKSSHYDVIPLCKSCHDEFHLHRVRFTNKNGSQKDLVARTKAQVEQLKTWEPIDSI